MPNSSDNLPKTNGLYGPSTAQHHGSTTSNITLDVSKLHSLPSEQQNLYLLTFTLGLENHTCSLNHESTCSQQGGIIQELFKIVNLASPIPTRVIRNSLGRCWSYILDKGDRKPLYESINQLLAIISAGKSDKELHCRHAAVYCLGEVYRAAGDSAITLSNVSCSGLLRLVKTAQNHVGLRAAIYRALGKLVASVRTSLDEGVAREAWKSARTAASSDKAALVQANACWCLEQLVRSTSHFDSASESEALKTTIWKTCDSPKALARRAAASCLATHLVKAFSESAAPTLDHKPKKHKKSGKNQVTTFEDGDEVPSRPASPAAKRSTVKLELNLADLLTQLSSHYFRTSTSNKTRAAITHCYIKVLQRLDRSVVQASYGQIAAHLLSELLSSASISYDRYRLLLTRKYVQKILADCLGSQILAESGRLSAAKTLINNVLKNYPQAVKEIEEPSKQALVGALDALASLIESLGSVFISVSDMCQDALLQVLQHPSYTVQIQAAYCLRVFVQACPQHLIHCASICMNNATREISHLTTGRHSHRRCVGFANGLAAVLSVSPLQPLYGSLEISSRALSIATELLKDSGKSEIRVSSTQVQVAWILIGGLMSMGPDFVKIHISQLLLLWRNALPKPLMKENTIQRDVVELNYLTHVRECALGSILSFLESNQRLVTLDVSNRIVVLLQNTVEFLETLPTRAKDEGPSSRIVPSLQLIDLSVMVRRRVLQCYTQLIVFGPASGADALGDSKLLSSANRTRAKALPDPPATEVVNSAITLFAVVFPSQSPKVQEFVLEQLATYLSAGALQRTPGRRAAVVVNTVMALLGALKVAVGGFLADSGDLKHAAVEKALQALLKNFLIDPDRHLRQLAYEALDLIVSNREPQARAGYALALGSIHSNVGGMAAGLHLKTTHGVLMSLCGDPHPIVHYCAINALSQVAESAGLAFSGYVSSTLGLLAQAWSSDAHNEESAVLATSNSELEIPTPEAVAHGIRSMINVLGPDLQDASKARELITSLMNQFERDSSPSVQAEGLRCWEHMYLYDPGHIALSTYVKHLQRNLESPDGLLCSIAADGLYNLVRRDAQMAVRLAGEGFEEQVWLTLNDRPKLDALRNLVETWLGQTCLAEVEKWISRIQQILTKSVAKQVEEVPQSAKPGAEPDLQDEEVAGFATGEVKDQSAVAAPEPSQELLRWQVRVFALQCLSQLVTIIGRDKDLDNDSPATRVLQSKVGEVVRMAFHASTSPVVELRVGGLKLINQILIIFGSTPDPDFSEALLLEQYQAQISSALTPAFNADSSPELASAAVNVCATFIATGMVTDIDRMGRILKLLVGALDSINAQDLQEMTVGDLRGLSPNAQTMVRMAVLSAWANLQVARADQHYLDKVLEPHIGKLLPLWLSSLQEFARLRFEPDISIHTGTPSPNESLETVYAALNRRTLLKFYQDSWLELVDAIASLIEQDPDYVFEALGSRKSIVQANGEKGETNIDYRDEPVAFFFVLFGIVIEALVTGPSNDSSINILKILSALKKILLPSIAGNAIFQDSVFSETIELFDRLALTEGMAVQGVIVDIAKSLCITHPAAAEEDTSSDLSEDIEQLFELARIIVLVLTTSLPNIADPKIPPRDRLADEAVPLVRDGFEALVDISTIFPSIIKTDLYASILHIFSTILRTPTCQASVVPQTLPVYRRFLQKITTDYLQPNLSAIAPQIRTSLHQMLAVLNVAQRREHERSLSCAKNTLLAISIMLTTASTAISPDEPLIFAALEAMMDCLQDLGLAKVAAGCLRSILLSMPKNEKDEAITGFLLPRLLLFITKIESPDPESVRTMVAQTLTAFVALYDDDEAEKAAAAMSMVLPALLLRAQSGGQETYKDTATRILELAKGELMPIFRRLVAGMDGEMRGFMEKVVREGGPGDSGVGRGGRDATGAGGAEGGGEPSIALKLDFGGLGR
ncbi:MAG: hypothetical protein Q9219_001522 [cf. Caloplaca sp. 3 TL-2023]